MAKGLHLRGGEAKSVFDKNAIEQTLINKYYNLFMNRFSINITNEAKDYLLRRLWANGTVAAFKLKSVDEDDNPDYLVFTDYAPCEYNIYDYPTKVTLINKRGVRFIPSRLLSVNKDVVIGYIQRNKKSVYSMIYPLIEKIVRAEITLNQNLRALRTPFLFVTDPENENKLVEFQNAIENGNAALFLTADDVKSMQIFNSGVNPIIDKLTTYIDKVDNDIKELLGVSNLGVNEKKEHLITAEVNVNNEVTADTRSVYFDCLQEFAEQIQDVFGITLNISEKETPSAASEGEIYDDV